MAKTAKNNKLAIVVSGGPAPGINGVISAATIEAINRGIEVLGIREGFKWIAEGNLKHIEKLTIGKTSRIHNTGGSIIGISRENPTSTKKRLSNTINSLNKLGVKYLITIGGDGTLYLANRIGKETKGRIKIAHIPKTIDNNLPMPGYIPTFGYETARNIGTSLLHYLMEDARTTNRWYFVVTMGRRTGHLALGIGKAAGATLTIIPEQFGSKPISLGVLVKILEGAIIKRLSMGREDGVAVIAEGIADRLEPGELEQLSDVARDKHGRIMLSEVDLGQLLKHRAREQLKEKGLDTRIVDKRIGYELRSAPPTPFDAKYTRDLGYSAVKFLLSGGTGAMLSIQTGKMVPLYFKDLVDKNTGKARVRYVDIDTESYEVAVKYMIKLNQNDLSNKNNLRKLAKAANMSSAEFKNYFHDIIEIV